MKTGALMEEIKLKNTPRVTDPSFADQVCVAIVDDDAIYRAGLRHYLSQDLRVEVTASGTHDEAIAWSSEVWGELDAVFVDIHDESVLAVSGEDVYRGITVLEVVRDRPLRTIAIVPTVENPLVNLRLAESGADEVYLRSEVADVDILVKAALEADHSRAPQLHADEVLAEHGARRTSRPNLVVAYYRESALYGKLHITKQVLVERRGVSRRQMTKLRTELEGHGFETPASDVGRRKRIRWPEARLVVLKIIGRRHVEDAPLPDESGEER